MLGGVVPSVPMGGVQRYITGLMALDVRPVLVGW